MFEQVEQKDIVLIPIPFTNLASYKRRPVIVISNNAYNKATGDMVVIAMTSNPVLTTYSFVITSIDLKNGSLKRPSVVRVDKIYTLSQKLIVQKFGQINISVLNKIYKVFSELIN